MVKNFMNDRETRALPTLDGNGMGVVSCPFCHCPHVHLSDVAVFMNESYIEIGYDPESGLPNIGGDIWERTPDVRGSSVGIGMFCENGCEFNACFAFHKGQVHVWAEFVGKQGKDDEPRPEMWRD